LTGQLEDVEMGTLPVSHVGFDMKVNYDILGWFEGHGDPGTQFFHVWMNYMTFALENPLSK